MKTTNLRMGGAKLKIDIQYKDKTGHKMNLFWSKMRVYFRWLSKDSVSKLGNDTQM